MPGSRPEIVPAMMPRIIAKVISNSISLCVSMVYNGFWFVGSVQSIFAQRREPNYFYT